MTDDDVLKDHSRSIWFAAIGRVWSVVGL